MLSGDKIQLKTPKPPNQRNPKENAQWRQTVSGGRLNITNK